MNRLALVAVPLGIIALTIVAWGERNLTRTPLVALAVVVFLAYMALVGILFAGLKRGDMAASVRCPH